MSWLWSVSADSLCVFFKKDQLTKKHQGPVFKTRECDTKLPSSEVIKDLSVSFYIDPAIFYMI